MKYFYRAFAIIYLLLALMWATSRIGVTPTSSPIEWPAAWGFFGVLLYAVWLGWAAAKEHSK